MDSLVLPEEGRSFAQQIGLPSDPPRENNLRSLPLEPLRADEEKGLSWRKVNLSQRELAYWAEEEARSLLDDIGQNRTLDVKGRVKGLRAIKSPVGGKEGYRWSRKQKRAFVKAKMGERAHKGGVQRFLTLTSSNEAKDDIGEDYRAFVLRVKRLTPYKLVKRGYIKKGDIRRYYPNKGPHAKLEFDYFKVRTLEGNGVLHILYYGDYIPQKWISDIWVSIHQSPIVDIRAGDYIKYVVSQYCASQSLFLNSSVSNSWCFKGCLGIWDWARRFMDLDKRISLIDALVNFGRAEVIHQGSRCLVEVGRPPPPSPVVFAGGFDPRTGKMVGSWILRAEAHLNKFGAWEAKNS